MSEGHGGRREGAGQKRKLDFDVRLRIATEVQKRLRKEIKAHTQRRIDAATERAGVKALQDDAAADRRKVPPKELPLLPGLMNSMTEDAVEMPAASEATMDAAESIVQVRAKLDGSENAHYRNTRPYGRKTTFRQFPPKGAKGRIERNLAEELSQKLGIRVTKDDVRRAFTEFRPMFEGARPE